MFFLLCVFCAWCFSYFVFVVLSVCATLLLSHSVLVQISWCHSVFVLPNFSSTRFLSKLILFVSLNIHLTLCSPTCCLSQAMFAPSNIYPPQCPTCWLSHLMFDQLDVFPLNVSYTLCVMFVPFDICPTTVGGIVYWTFHILLEL